MKISVKSAILGLFRDNKDLTVKEIADRLQVSKQMVHLALNRLLEEKVVEKLGRTPKTVYRVIEKTEKKTETFPSYEPTDDERSFLNNNFLIVSETGNLLQSFEAFDYWCRQRKLPVQKTLAEFIETKKKYEVYYDKQGFINGMEKLKNTKGYDKIWIDELYYLDFYAIERFGKTRLGTLLHFAKQGQNKFLMSILLSEIADRIRNFVKQHKADAIGFIPPTIKREVQFMKYIQTNLRIPLPIIEIKKMSGIIPVPQKSLSKLEERIRNADNTFIVSDQRNFKHVVLIDDAVGSGSTLNQVSQKIKNKNVAQKITGLAVVGSFKGFDVITDV